MTMGFLVALFLALVYAPIQRYRPSCGGRIIRYYFDGPMREIFVDKMAETMTRFGFPYVRLGNKLFIRVYYPRDGAMVCDIADRAAGTLSLADDVLNFLSASRRSAPFHRR